MNDFKRILSAIERGDPLATEQLLPLVYDELRRIAAAKMAHEGSAQTLQATALVHEAYLRLQGDQTHCWNSRAHFFAAAAEAMRRILVERPPQAQPQGRRRPAARAAPRHRADRGRPAGRPAGLARRAD